MFLFNLSKIAKTTILPILLQKTTLFRIWQRTYNQIFKKELGSYKGAKYYWTTLVETLRTIENYRGKGERGHCA